MNVTNRWAEDEFEAIFREHFARLMRVTRRVLGSEAEAEEVCSEVFLRLYRCGPHAIADGSAGGWLYRSGTRAAIDALRRNRRRHEEELAEDAGERLPADADDPLGSVLRAERIAHVRGALARMQVEKAQLLLLRHSGLSYQEISAALKIGASSVGKMLARAEAEFSKIYRRQQQMSEAAPRLEAAKEER
ncbi:MAG: sigma-70 family RNA polymerase sigma factor [Terracidiphilus sp.]